MSCLNLSIIRKHIGSYLDEDKIDLLIKYFALLNMNTYNIITVSKISRSLKIDAETSLRLLNDLVEYKILDVDFGVRCPDCGLLLKRYRVLQEIESDNEIYCYNCENYFDGSEVEESDIEVLFTLEDKSFFINGQYTEKIHNNSSHIAQESTLDFYIKNGGNPNYTYYNPSQEEYDKLNELYNDLKETNKLTIGDDGLTTTTKGDKLEDFIIYLFELIKGLRATKEINTELNQIDIYIRMKTFNVIPIFNTMGERICIECKNEEVTPDNGYMHKLNGIISHINMTKNYVKFGIIASVFNPPKTFHRHSIRNFIINRGRIIITLCDKDYKQIVEEKCNLLELLDRKSEEIITECNLESTGLFEV